MARTTCVSAAATQTEAELDAADESGAEVAVFLLLMFGNRRSTKNIGHLQSPERLFP